MNPLIKQTVDKLSLHMKLTQSEKMFIANEVGNALFKALSSAAKNPDYNLCGGDSVDKNTIGNF